MQAVMVDNIRSYTCSGSAVSMEVEGEETITVLENHEESVEVKQKTLQPDIGITPFNIVVVGLAGSGKTSLINKLCELESDDKSLEDYKLSATAHSHYIKEHQLKIDDVMLDIYDTPGLSNPNVSAKKLLTQLSKNLKEINILLICLKLYGKVDNPVIGMMKKIRKHCGKDIFSRTIVVLTQADEYQVHCRSYRESQGEEKIKEEISQRINSVTDALQSMVVDNQKLITKDTFLCIPVCISSSQMKELFTTDNWMEDLKRVILQKYTDTMATNNVGRHCGLCCLSPQDE